MIKVRHNVFETNSSSVHSLVVAAEATEPQEDVIFEIDEFGWECAVYCDTFDKASYFYTAACELYKRDMANEIRELLEPYGIVCIFKVPAHFNPEYGYLDNGGIDHYDETREFVEALLGNSDELIRFLFNPNSFIITCNDNMEEEDWNEVKRLLAIPYDHTLYVKGN